MSRQHGLENIARNIALFGAACWAAERVQARLLPAPWTQAAEKSAINATPSEVRRSMLARGISALNAEVPAL
jgi:hypothetical protein